MLKTLKPTEEEQETMREMCIPFCKGMTIPMSIE